MVQTQRSYHDTDSPYSLPNDNAEHARLEHQSEALNKMMGDTAFQTVLINPQRIVDIGCGTGILTTALAEAYPTSKVYGIDLSKVPETLRRQPVNVEYVTGDFNKLAGNDERFRNGTFDLVFHRMLICGMTDWPDYVRRCFELLQSGGRIELQDLSYRTYDIDGNDLPGKRHWVSVMETFSRTGVDPLCGERIKGLMERTGFVDVKERKYMWKWSDEPWEQYPDSDAIGKYSVRELVPAFTTMVGKVFENAGCGSEEIRALQDDAMRDLTMGKVPHMIFYVVTGRKP